MTTASELRSGKTHRDENFPVASWIIHRRHRALILAFYNFVRTADDIADHATLGEQRFSTDALSLQGKALMSAGDLGNPALVDYSVRQVFFQMGNGELFSVYAVDDKDPDPDASIKYSTPLPPVCS